MPTITTRDPEVDVDKGSFDCDIDETSTKPAPEECSESHNDEQMNAVPQP